MNTSTPILQTVCSLTVLAVTLTFAAHSHGANEERPNIVLILTDDLGIGDCRAYNPDSKIPTPNIDRLATHGVRFTDAHSPSAVCTPTRYSILTGEYAWRTRLKRGVFNGYSRSLLGNKTTIAELLHRHGYTTACVGKWHLSLGTFDPKEPMKKIDYQQPIDTGPHTEGFEYSFIIPASLDMPPYVYVENGIVVEQPTDYTDGSRSRRSGGGGFWRAGPMAPGFEFDQVVPTIADRAITWIDEASQGDRPFFLYLPLPAPHTPWVPTAEFTGRSEAGTYGDFVAQTDAVVGRIIAALEQQGALDNTLIIFTSDNGAHWLPSDIVQFSHRANAHLRGQKADIHEGGHRIPLVIQWPGHAPANTEADALVGLHDIFATIGEMIGADTDQLAGAVDSVSFLSAIRGGEGSRHTLVNHSLDGMSAIRRDNWKLIEGLGSGGFTAPKRIKSDDPEAGQLFDLNADPGEAHDVFADHPDIVDELRSILKETRNQPAANAAHRSESEPEVFLFPYFLNNGEAGVYLAWSQDGLTFENLAGGQPILPAPNWPGENLTRDPSILLHNEVFHMVWTTGWNTRSIGYASSCDLVNWSEPRKIDIWPGRDDIKNTWAPELHWDPERSEFFVLWSSTTSAELKDNDGTGNPHGYDHRSYISRTSDFQTFSEPELFYSTHDPELSIIDPFIAFDSGDDAEDPSDNRWVMVIKNEMYERDGGKNLCLTFAPHMQGPYTPTLSAPIVGAGTDIVNSMSEGPSLIRRDGLWWLYWDAPGSGLDYCLATSSDLVHWTNRSDEIVMPLQGVRHGTVLVVPRSTVGHLTTRDGSRPD